MQVHWGHFCIFIGGIFLFFVEVFIALNPSLDASFTPIKINNTPLLRTHNYFEMLGFFVFGLGFSKTLQIKTTPEKLKKFQTFGNWIILSTFLVVTVTYLLVFASFGGLLLIFPLPLGYYIYNIYSHKKGKTVIIE